VLENHASREKVMVDVSRTGAAARVLLVEDDAEISAMLADTLREHGFHVAVAPSADGMDALLSREVADIIVLDVMLPGEDGLSICRRLRSTSMIPIIMLTALGGEVDRVVGLEIGADDYVTKPFRSRELIARIRALLRRAQGDQSQGGSMSRITVFQFAGWTLEPFSRQLLNPQRVRISLTSAEFDLLLAFCSNPGRVLSREQLLELTHGGAAGPIARSIDVHVSRVRQKIDPEPAETSFIKTVRLGGYIFTPTVEAV
jgi:two-component system OmpR family response regulator